MYFAPSKNGGTGHIADRLKTLRKVNETRVREAPKKSDIVKITTFDLEECIRMV